MTHGQKLAIGRAFGLAIVLWAVMTVSLLVFGMVVGEPIMIIVGVCGFLGTAGIYGIAVEVHRRLFKA